jgi:hypothetical protein
MLKFINCLTFLGVLAIAALWCRHSLVAESPRAEAAARPVPADPLTDSPKLRWNACYEAQKYIKAALKAPASADFPNCYSQDELANTTLLDGKPGDYVVTTYADAQNSFGAKTRSYFMCPVVVPDADHFKMQQCVETDSSHKTTLNIF